MKNIYGVYFSPTGTTKKIVTTITQTLSEKLQLSPKYKSFTLPGERSTALTFDKEDVVVFGMPVYAGRVPSLLLKFLATVEGCGALAIPVVLYGNRNYDDALVELRDILEKAGMHTVAAGAFIGEHSFSRTLGANRPDAEDLAKAISFAMDAAQKIADETYTTPVAVKGEVPYRPYYVPKMADGSKKNIITVYPKVNSDKCIKCGLCVKLCPLGTILPEDVSTYSGKCIKCCACVKGCPQEARYFDDEVYLYHKKNLEESFVRRAEPEVFL